MKIHTRPTLDHDLFVAGAKPARGTIWEGCGNTLICINGGNETFPADFINLNTGGHTRPQQAFQDATHVVIYSNINAWLAHAKGVKTYVPTRTPSSSYDEE
jgi:hypothetical protein